MYKIGCIGHAGRHGEFLSRIFNREKRFDGYRFSYVFGEDEELTLEQKDERFYQVDGYCSTVDELIERSDAVMILTIPGESHLPYALKVIEAGERLSGNRLRCLSHRPHTWRCRAPIIRRYSGSR